MSQVILIHYNEVGLKGGNRRMFEQQLQNNIQKVLDDLFVAESHSRTRVKWQYGRLYVENFSESDWPKIKEHLQKIFGIANFVLAEKVTACFDKIKQAISDFLCHSRQSFRVTCRRAQKDFPLSSQQINEQLGKFIQKKTQTRVDLKNPDIIFYVEIVNKSAFVYVGRDSSAAPQNDNDGIIQGAGGLPVGVSGKAVCLVSGGIDSPAAAWLAMKRGLEIYFVHFHSAPQTNTASQDKVERLVEILNQWQTSLSLRGPRTPQLLLKVRGAGDVAIPNSEIIHALRLPRFAPHLRASEGLARNGNLTMIPFLEFQKKVLTKTPAKYRVILYRREMMRQAEKLAQQIGARAIITGEALGQVASQTIENLAVIEQAVNLPVLRPLICFDKQEIIKLAQKIGTYEISTEPHQDCCSLFVPEHPATKANLADILKVEKDL